MKEKEEESRVVAQSLKAFPNPVPPGIRELGGLLYQQASCGPVLLSQLLKTGPREWIGNGRDLGLLSQDQVIELFVLEMCYLWTFQQLGHEARGLCQIPLFFSHCCIIKLELFVDGRIHKRLPQTSEWAIKSKLYFLSVSVFLFRHSVEPVHFSCLLQELILIFL